MNQELTINQSPRRVIEEANRLASAGDHGRAMAILNELLSRHPDHAGALNELGVTHYQVGDIACAKTCFEKAVASRSDFPRALVNLGACCNELKDNTAAIRHYKAAISLMPDMVDAWGNLAKAYTESEEFEMAVYCYRHALNLDRRPDFLRGLAKAYRKSGRNNRAEALLREVIASNPADADAHFGLSFSLFHRQAHGEALRAFEWRRRTREMVQHEKDLYPIFEKPGYNGEDLREKTLLLHTEQGFGDCLQFARFIRLLEGKVGKLVLWTRPGLGKLLSDNFAFVAYSENVFELPPFDCQLPLLSIPYWFDPELASLGDFTPYISAPADSPSYTGDRVDIGLVWGASDSGFDYANKKVPLELLQPLVELPGTRWHSLQVGSDCADLATCSFRQQLHNPAARFKTFTDTARAIANLDLVISCDTSVAHLAGAMGKPVWVMLKKEPDWRWGADGETTPWYPSARLFRQQSHGDWSLVIRRLRRTLEQLVAAHKTAGEGVQRHG